ncbi:hypothetical protein HK098_008143 [Nowakowskiella sp. JEL0407]|nr:hypothetical protein HK098_008143 [Nowakowskiella sp. JEL0407]
MDTSESNNQSGYRNFLKSLQSNQTLKHVTIQFTYDPSQIYIFDQFLKVLEVNSRLESVTIDVPETHFFHLKSTIKATLKNSCSSIRKIILKNEGEWEIEFWCDGQRRVWPKLIARTVDVGYYGMRTGMGFEISEIIDGWRNDARELLVDTIVFDDLKQSEMNALLTWLCIKESMSRNENIIFGYKEGSICLWYDRHEIM